MAYRARPSLETIRKQAVANPAVEVQQFRNRYGPGGAGEFAAAKEAEGFRVRHGQTKLGPRGPGGWVMFNVHVYAKKGQGQ